jgi:transcriptional regulator of acetoin/glycerol metabolism
MAILNETGGSCTKAARILGVSRTTVYNKAKAYGLCVKKLNKTD